MQKIKKLYRSGYTGEDIVSEMTLTQGHWVKTHENMSASVNHSSADAKAIVLGNGSSRVSLYPDLFAILKHHSTMKLYGCNAIMRDFTPDFVVASDAMMDEFVQQGYYDQTVVYGTAKMIETHPGKFYHIPQNPNWNTGAMAVYLACFDGARTVYLMGHDLFSQEHNYQSNVYAGTSGYPETYDLTTEGYFEHSMLMVMQTYDDVDFVRVAPSNTQYMPESWKYLLNLRQIDFREFVIETNLG